MESDDSVVQSPAPTEAAETPTQQQKIWDLTLCTLNQAEGTNSFKADPITNQITFKVSACVDPQYSPTIEIWLQYRTDTIWMDVKTFDDLLFLNIAVDGNLTFNVEHKQGTSYIVLQSLDQEKYIVSFTINELKFVEPNGRYRLAARVIVSDDIWCEIYTDEFSVEKNPFSSIIADHNRQIFNHLERVTFEDDDIRRALYTELCNNAMFMYQVKSVFSEQLLPLIVPKLCELFLSMQYSGHLAIIMEKINKVADIQLENTDRIISVFPSLLSQNTNAHFELSNSNEILEEFAKQFGGLVVERRIAHKSEIERTGLVALISRDKFIANAKVLLTLRVSSSLTDNMNESTIPSITVLAEITGEWVTMMTSTATLTRISPTDFEGSVEFMITDDLRNSIQKINNSKRKDANVFTWCLFSVAKPFHYDLGQVEFRVVNKNAFAQARIQQIMQSSKFLSIEPNTGKAGDDVYLKVQLPKFANLPAINLKKYAFMVTFGDQEAQVQNAYVSSADMIIITVLVPKINVMTTSFIANVSVEGVNETLTFAYTTNEDTEMPLEQPIKIRRLDSLK